MIAATDVAPSVLRFLGIGVPEAMEGESIEGRGDADAAAVRGLGDRLAVVTSRRGDALIWLAASWSLVLVLLRAAGGAAGGRAALRIGLLGVLWLPGLALLTSALAPARLTEVAILGLGSVALGAATDRALRWPLAPALPASVVFVAHAIDLAAGSPLIAGSLAGSNPAGGARFFGIGNELEALLSVSVLIGAGGALSGAATGGSRAAVAIAGAAGSAALVMGAGRLGADVGAVITLGAGGAAAFVTALPGPVTRRRIAVAIAAPAAALVALIAIDLASGGGAHLTRSVLEANGSGDLVDVATRRIESSVANLGKPGWAIATALALVAVVWLALWRARFQAVVPRPFAAGLVGAWFAVVVGALANDSGPLILDLGAVLLLLGAAYARARPVEPRRPGIAARLHGCA